MPDDSTYLSMLVRAIADAHVSFGDSPNEDTKDINYVVRRYDSEGIKFLTCTLPLLGKALDASFNSGRLDVPTSFKLDKHTRLPAFLRAFFRRVYSNDGELLPIPNPAAVGHIRQVCFMMYKLEDDYSADTVQRTIDAFCAVDEDLANVDLSSDELRPIIIEAKRMLTRLFVDFDPYDILPRPGPGASASGTRKHQRYEMLTHWDQTHQVYPFYEYFYVNRKHLVDRASDYRKAPRRKEPASRMRLVPKDSRGPRIICMEEQEVMFLQQGLADKMRDHIEAHPLTKGCVNFRNQEINRQLAKNASVSAFSGEFRKATLDMKEASDRVSRQLVATLFGGTTLLRALLALSTRRIVLPCGSERETLKFAPMGSSLCFPVMSLVHFALGRAIIKCTSGKRDNAAILAKCMHVYGDDLIVDVQHVASLFEWFPKFGLKFNEGKSFWQGPFRESCGFDAFLGRNVSPQRIKRRFFDSTTPKDLLSALDLESLLHERGYTMTAEYIRTVVAHRWAEADAKMVERDKSHRPLGALPFVMRGSAALGWRRIHPSECDISSLKSRRNRDEQRKEVRARVVVTEPTVSLAGGWEQLLRQQTGVIRGSDRLSGPFDRYSIAWRWVDRTELTEHKGVQPKWLNFL